MNARRRSPCDFAHPTTRVCKLNARGEAVYCYPARLLWQGQESLTVAATFRMDDVTVGGLLLAAGDCFVETYYANYWYNVFGIYARDSHRLRGWYANIGEPIALTPEHIAYRDLALDLIVLPDGTQTVLDADEFAALHLPPAEARRARQALNILQQRFCRYLRLLAQ